LRLIDLLNGYQAGVREEAAIAASDITGLTSDSRQVRAGYLFAALPGSYNDGRSFISAAIQQGAAAVLAPTGTRLPPVDRGRRETVPLIVDDNPRRCLALLAARFFGRQPATVAAVTGTNGKTSVVSFLRQIWTRLGKPAAGLGTLGLEAPGIFRSGSLTTPDPVDLHRTVAELAAGGIDCLALEASSHGLDQYRLDGLRIDAAAFTNLSRDHLDYHRSMDAYFAAKRRLFAELVVDGGSAVINADEREAPELTHVARGRGLLVIDFGRTAEGVRLRSLAAVPHGQRLSLTVTGQNLEVLLPLVGDFQASNALCALALALATGCEAEPATLALAALASVRGRLEKAATLANGAAVYVDYAHTPQALAAALRALRPHTRRQLQVVFGCGGDRDPGKRPEMGRIAGALADRVIVTDDNPRNETPARIREQVLAGCADATEIEPRGEAIARAIDGLAAGDVLLVAGKGHETGQIIGDEVLPFDDAATVRQLVGEGGG
jgi:UDP-N-acetylmuramoyl-L-alanyl-D-glutamate--2,6-diaminopimelate ligase